MAEGQWEYLRDVDRHLSPHAEDVSLWNYNTEVKIFLHIEMKL